LKKIYKDEIKLSMNEFCSGKKGVYLFEFDGEQLYDYRDNKLGMRHFYENMSLEDVYKSLFFGNRQNRVDEMCDLFSYPIDLIGGDCFDLVFLGTSMKKKMEKRKKEHENEGMEDRLVNCFIRYFRKKGKDTFFESIDSTWKKRDIISYSFVESDDLPKLLRILSHTGNLG
jgi:hypothetical protein